MTDLTVLIQQALNNGDTETAQSLSKVLEHQTKISVIPLEQPIEYIETYQPTYIPPAKVQIISISWWLCFIILPYLAIAEVLAPGHQGLLKINHMDLDWPVVLVTNTFTAVTRGLNEQ